MNNLDRQYKELLEYVMRFGNEKSDRTGTGTKSIFSWELRHNMKEGFPLLTTKKMYWKGIVTELLWFLRGETNIKYLLDNGCHIWDGDTYKRYLVHTIEGVKNGFDRIKGYLDDCLVEFDGSYEHFTNPSFQYGYRPYTQEEFINRIKTDDEFAKKWGELGPIYGKQWRSWKSATLEEQWGYGKIEGHPIGGNQYSKFNTNIQIDQIANLIFELKTNPDSRRLMVNAWNVGELDQMVLPPCHYGFQVYTRELSLEERENLMDKIYGLTNETRQVPWHIVDIDKHNIPTRAISLMWSQRSVDVGLGLGFNIASYGLLLEIIAKEVNMVPDELIGNLGDCHLYLDHVEPIKVQLEREPFELPKLRIKPNLFEFGKPDQGKLELDYYSYSNFELESYQSHPAIKAPLSN